MYCAIWLASYLSSSTKVQRNGVTSEGKESPHCTLVARCSAVIGNDVWRDGVEGLVIEGASNGGGSTALVCDCGLMLVAMDCDEIIDQIGQPRHREHHLSKLFSKKGEIKVCWVMYFVQDRCSLSKGSVRSVLSWFLCCLRWWFHYLGENPSFTLLTSFLQATNK